MRDGSMEGRRCFVSGATSGIGLATCVGLARRGAHVVMGGRDPQRTESARHQVAEVSGSEAPDVALGDLGALARVRELAAELRARLDRLDVLIANAGVVTARRELTEDGFERMFAVNHLAHFVLVLELLPLLRRARAPRIVIVSSDAHRFGRLDLEDLQSEAGFGFPAPVSAMRVYGGSKLANLLFVHALTKRLAGTDVTVNAVHPGAVATNLGRSSDSWYSLLPALVAPFFKTPERGATASLHAACSDAARGASGAYYVDERRVTPAARARDPRTAELLWERSCELSGHSGTLDVSSETGESTA